MSYVNQHTFDWGMTERDVVLFIPNFKRKHLLIPTLMQIETTLPKDEWIVLVVNDGPHEDLSDLKEFNTVYFTFERDPEKERNGCLIRNYVLKKLRSKIMTTRDPEIFIKGNDHIKAVSEMSDCIYRPYSMTELLEPLTPQILKNPMIDVTTLGSRAVHKLTNPGEHRAFHAGVSVYVRRLMGIGGYDEDFANFYGWEDIDMLYRLVQSGADIIVDKNVNTFHVWHPRKTRFLKTVTSNQFVYQCKREEDKLVANENKDWGEGI